MKIKKNTFSTLVSELFFPSIANCRKLKIQKNPKIDFPYYTVIVVLRKTLETNEKEPHYKKTFRTF
jgi:hypothetical protein